MQSLEEILGLLTELPPEQRAEVEALALSATGDKVWVPNPGPQTEAYFSPADEVFYGGQAGGGKRLNIKEILPTPTGFVSMGDVRVGDQVFDAAGSVCNVVAVSDVEEAGQAYAVHFSDGTVIEADGDHLWLTFSNRERDQLRSSTGEWRAKRRARRPSRAVGDSKKPWVSDSISRINRDRQYDIKVPQGTVRTTHEILATLRTGGKRNALNHAVPIAGALVLPETRLPVDPYLLGLWLGDGFSRGNCGIGMSAEDWADIHKYVEDEVSSIREERVAHPNLQPFNVYNFMGFSLALKELGLYGNKRIPAAYLRASIEQRRELLRGVLDTDGHCTNRGAIELALSSKDLLEDVYELVCSLGLKTSITVRRLSDKNPKHRDSYRLKFMADFPAFKLPRKLDRQKLDGFRKTGKYRYITSVEPISPVKMRCIGVDSPTHLYLAGRSMVPTHNTDLEIGLALTAHYRSLILRRTNREAGGLVERLAEILGTRDGWNSQTGMWRRPDDRIITIGGCQLEEDKQGFKGVPRDLYCFDEVSDFTETQYKFIIGWNRSTRPGQRCRVVAAGNPPTRPEGLWVLTRWGAWLDPQHPNPARPGELRWYTTGEDGTEIEVDGPGPHRIRGEDVYARSRTFIPATLADNPDLKGTGYQASLDSLPEELRAAYRDGNFATTLKDDAYQVIPTAWVKEAQQRWTAQPPTGVPMCAIGCDVAVAHDNFVLAPRHDLWFDKLLVVPGKEIKDAKHMAGKVLAIRRDNASVIVDLGGGWGADCHAQLIANGIESIGYMGVKPTKRKTKDGKFTFSNVRSEAYWKMREALDPSQPGGSRVCLPNDNILTADLCAPTYKVKGQNGGMVLSIESKEDIVKRLARSPDRGDAVVMSNYAGIKQENILNGWAGALEGRSTNYTPPVNRGRRYNR